MAEMDMAFFGGSFGFSGQDPVGGLVAGALEAVFFNESLQQIHGIMIGVKPVIRDSSGI